MSSSPGNNYLATGWPAIGPARVLLVLDRPVLVERVTLALNYGVCTTRAQARARGQAAALERMSLQEDHLVPA